MTTESIEAKALVDSAEKRCQHVFHKIEATEYKNQERVLKSFQKNHVASRHFSSTNGYGYDDIGRDTLDCVFSDALQTEAAFVRPQFVNGTHALFVMLAGISKPGTLILSVTGRPYDTLQEAIGIRGNQPGSLASFGVLYNQIDLKENGCINAKAVLKKLKSCPKNTVVYVQRSRGYAWRPSFGRKALETLFQSIHKEFPNVVIAVDNCYCEFVEETEPVTYGADIMAGSLIKNPGGGLAATGGYIAGKKELVKMAADRLTIPGIGGEVGSYAASYRMFYQGLFMAPHTVSQCMKSAVLFSAVMKELGYEVLPDVRSERSDIVQSIHFHTAEELITFCKQIQASSPIDSDVVPEPWDMPGYSDQVIMAAGTFVQGATNELSADGPIRKPYTAYLQGALTYPHGKIAAVAVTGALLSEKKRAGEK